MSSRTCLWQSLRTGNSWKIIHLPKFAKELRLLLPTQTSWSSWLRTKDNAGEKLPELLLQKPCNCCCYREWRHLAWRQHPELSESWRSDRMLYWVNIKSYYKVSGSVRFSSYEIGKTIYRTINVKCSCLATRIDLHRSPLWILK